MPPRQSDIRTLLDARRHLRDVLLELGEAARHFAALAGTPLEAQGAAGLALCGRLVGEVNGWLQGTAGACLDAARQTGEALRRHAPDSREGHQNAAPAQP